MSSIPRTSITLADAAPRLAAAQAEFQAVAYPGKVDLVTRELVRITSGRLSRCSYCRNLRLRAAIKRGFEEEMVAQLDDVGASNLTDARKIAVRFARAFLTDPAAFGPADRAELRRHFDDEQVAELVLDLVRFRPGSKLAVASGAEPAVDELVVI
jgi:alkylhydroperoxidase family enzyme